MSHPSKLDDVKIRRYGGDECRSCNGTQFTYSIPCRLDGDIIEFIKPMGESPFDFEKTCLLRIENTNYSIIGIKRLKEIRFVLKNNKLESYRDNFEDIIISYVRHKTSV